MDYEKKYKEALERMRYVVIEPKNENMLQAIKETVFPELKESDDEKTRKEIVGYLKRNLRLEWAAWLEKQGRQKPLYIRFGDVPSNETSKIYRGEVEIGDENGVSVYPAFELNGNIVLGLTLPITKTTLYTQQHLLEYDNRPCYLVSGDYVGKGTDGEPLIKNISIIKKLDNYRIKECEKKPVIEMITPEESLGIDSETYNEIVNACIFDENKPKFKVGNWINDYYTNYKVLSVNNKGYVVEDVDRNKINILFENEKFHHLWTIADAKDGDVLSDGTTIFIFKDLLSDGSVMSYCDYDTDSGESDAFCPLSVNLICSKITPATREQRDQLERAMTNAGYKWNKEELKLEKI